MRKLASIQRILSIEPIENADSLEVATVLGWHCVVKKSEFSVGDLVVYIECDAVLPEIPEFEFMRPRHFRVKTIKLRGQVSQGLVFPLSILPKEYLSSIMHDDDFYGTPLENRDVTELLGITKYDPPLPAQLAGTAKGNFPSFIPKTDETRVQCLQRVLDKYQGTLCYITEKLDGSSATFYINNSEFGVCSRNLDLKETEGNSFWKTARALDIEDKLRSLEKNIALQGELIGEGIQGNKYDIKGQTVRFFNAFDIDKHEYLDSNKFFALMGKLRLSVVPVLANDYVLVNNIDEIIDNSIGKSSLKPSVQREGIVIRPMVNQYEHRDFGEIGRVSFKAINPQFLLKYGE